MRVRVSLEAPSPTAGHAKPTTTTHSPKTRLTDELPNHQQHSLTHDHNPPKSPPQKTRTRRCRPCTPWPPRSRGPLPPSPPTSRPPPRPAPSPLPRHSPSPSPPPPCPAAAAAPPRPPSASAAASSCRRRRWGRRGLRRDRRRRARPGWRWSRRLFVCWFDVMVVDGFG